jgi:hypothetical protein
LFSITIKKTDPFWDGVIGAGAVGLGKARLPVGAAGAHEAKSSSAAGAAPQTAVGLNRVAAGQAVLEAADPVAAYS